jgi:hypothetical protein
MTTHEHLSIEILADYAEGLLGDADATSVAEHLSSCGDCQAEADLLVSVSSILAADDPGPMPAHYAARIDAALADLAAAEPVAPKRATPVGEGAAVIDLASRRRFTPAARVTSVAASLVLLIGGVALGMQALDSSNTGDPDAPFAGGAPEAQETLQPGVDRASLYAQVEAPKGEDRKKGKNGAVIDKNTGTVFIKNKVLFPDGTVVVHRKSGIAEVRTFSNGQIQVEQVPSPRGGGRPVVNAPAPTPEAPAATVARTPEATPKPTPEPTPDPTVAPATPVPSNPWVENSGEAYTPDNFATKVQALLRNSGDTVAASGAGSTEGPVDQNRVSSGAVRDQDAAVKTRGPAPAEVAAKVKRCANQLGLTDVLAGDAGTWRGEAATVVVTRLGTSQATGYVIYGDCTREAPATPADIQWEQRVDLPSVETETPAPSDAPSPEVSSGVTSSASPRVDNELATSVEQ